MEQGTKTTPANEIWRPVRDFEGLYEVSNLGRVRSLDRITISKSGLRRRIKGKIIKAVPNNLGYMHLLLSCDGVSKTKPIHRLVADAFVYNPNNLPEVNHKDENKANNSADNLEWCDRSYNVNYGTGIRRRAIAKSKPIEQLTLDGKHVAYYESSDVAGRLNSCDPSYIRKVIRGEKASAFGYVWRAIEGSTDGLRLETEPIEPIGKKPTKVEQLTLDGKHVAYYESMSAAAKAVSCSIQNIYRTMIGINKTAKGYKWRYV